MPRQYFTNTILAILISFFVWLIFARFSGFSSNSIILATVTFGLPHFLVAALGYFSKEPQKAVLPFVIATIVAGLIGFTLKSMSSFYLAQLIFYGYFLAHLLKDELMLEESSRTGYFKMTSSMPQITQFAFVLVPLAFYGFFGFSYLGKTFIEVPSYIGILLILPLPLMLLIKNKAQSNFPAGFIFFFISLLGLLFLWTGRQTFETGTHIRTFIGLYHFATWYVFYTKRLVHKPKVDQGFKFNFRNLLFAYNRSPKAFWVYILFFQAITFGLLAIYLFSPQKLITTYIFSDGWWQFWTIWHVTTSFIGKADFKPIFSFFWPKRQQLAGTYSQDANSFAKS